MDVLLSLRQELALALIVLVLLLIQLGSSGYRNETVLGIVNVLLFLNLLSGLAGNIEGVAFGGAFHTGKLVVLEKNLLNLGTLIVSMQAYDWLRNHRYVVEFYVLLLSTLLGLFLMISAGNLLLFYLGLELSTIPLAALAGFDLSRSGSSEAAVKFIMSSAFSSGLLLFGISLVYGTTGSLSFAEIGSHLDGSPLQLFAFILLLSGFGFKMSAVPFHWWTADVYEGSPVPVAAYLSVMSKGGVIFVLVPVLYTVFRPMAHDWYGLLVVLSVLTMLTGNLFALRQQNLKRLLAYSSIAQVGFILVGMSGGTRAASASVVYFILVYIVSNLGAFGVVGLVSSLTGREGIDDYKGLYGSNRFLSWVLAICLFSLAGVPPTAGFFGKFFLLTAGAGRGNFLFIGFAALNMILSLYYYLRVIRAVFMETGDRPLERLPVPLWTRVGLWICLAGVLCVGVAGGIYDYIYSIC